MAWRRTALSVTVCCFLIFHIAVTLGALAVGLTAVGLGAVIAAVSVFAFPAHRYRRPATRDSAWILLVSVVAAAVALAVLGVLAATLTVLA